MNRFHCTIWNRCDMFADREGQSNQVGSTVVTAHDRREAAALAYCELISPGRLQKLKELNAPAVIREAENAASVNLALVEHVCPSGLPGFRLDNSVELWDVSVESTAD
jgi:hypothetical protein